MSKKKVSSEDFMDLLDDQEGTTELPAFSPGKAKAKSAKVTEAIERAAKSDLTNAPKRPSMAREAEERADDDGMPKSRRPRKPTPLQMKIGKYTLGPAQTEVLRFVMTKGQALASDLSTKGQALANRGQAIANDLSSKGHSLANDLSSKGQALANDLTSRPQVHAMVLRAEKTFGVLRERLQRWRQR